MLDDNLLVFVNMIDFFRSYHLFMSLSYLINHLINFITFTNYSKLIGLVLLKQKLEVKKINIMMMDIFLTQYYDNYFFINYLYLVSNSDYYYYV